jgi:hypothetical protein
MGIRPAGTGYGGKIMMQPEGGILAQMQEIVDEEIQNLFNNYSRIEKEILDGENYFCEGGIKVKYSRIEASCAATIRVKCGYLMKAVRNYKTCPRCGGWGNYMGLSSYEWCWECNCFQEVEV